MPRPVFIFIKNTLFAFLLGAFVILGLASILVRAPHPLSQEFSCLKSPGEKGISYFWNQERLAESKKEFQKSNALKQVLAEAEEALTWGPYSVVDKTRLPPSGNRHDFCDLSPYFWPNPILPGGKPYYFRDGLVNPEANGDSYDRTRYLQLLRALQRLALGYHFSRDEKYAQRATLLIRTWFLTPETRMSPHFRHSQVIPGLTDGFSLGIIRATELVQMLDTLALISSSPSWTPCDHEQLSAWFTDYLKWATTSSFGEREYRMRNNHGTWYDASTAAIAYFTGNPAIAKDLLARSAKKRIDIQISPDGNQPLETKRSRSLYYAIYNLKGLFSLAEMCERSDIDLWHYQGLRGQSLKKALDHLIPFTTGNKKWKGQKIIPDEGWESDFIPILRIAAEKFSDPAYLDAITKLPKLPSNHRVWILWNIKPETIP